MNILYSRPVEKQKANGKHQIKPRYALVFCCFLFAVCCLLLQAMPASAQINAGRGPLLVRSAWTLEPGYLNSYLHTRFFGKVSNVGNEAAAVAYWDVQGGLSLNYGLGSHFDLTLCSIGYQDHNQGGNGYNLVDDLFLTLKIGSLGRKRSSLSYGIDLGARFPTAKRHNIVFEPYSAGKASLGATGLLSYTRDPLYPEDGFSMHLNLGYWNHNDVGEKLSSFPSNIDTIRVQSMTQEFTYGVGFILPSEQFDFRLEIYGREFIQPPPVTAYSRERVTYLSPGVSYRPYRWMTLDFSLDLRISSNIDNTLYMEGNSAVGVMRIPDMPNYPGWRVTLGMKLGLLPTSLYEMSERDILIRKGESRRELFERIIREHKETEEAERELEEIRQQRIKTERELERLRRILEGKPEQKQEEEKKENKDNKDNREKP